MEIYRNPEYSTSERVEDLLSRMTLEQKIAQLHCVMLTGKPDRVFANYPDGSGASTGTFMGKTVEENADIAEYVQGIIQSKNDLGIPALLHCESITGVNAVGTMIYPSAIGLGATWQPQTVQRMAEFIREEMLAIGIRQALSPVMDVARDPRWGRIGEAYGEDPTHAAAMSVAFTKGLQGEDLKDGVLATGKHFLGYGMSEGGLNMTTNPIPERELREVHAKPFQAAITEAGLGSMMNSYGTIDGELVINSSRILDTLLREEMGFDGLVVADYMSINRAVDLKVSENAKLGGVAALKAGLDMELPMPFGYAVETMGAAVEEGLIEEEYIDRAVRRILKAKFELGLFENAGPRKELLSKVFSEGAARAHSLKAARESIVLVKNDGILPLSKDLKKVAVIGPHGDSLRLLFGCYTYPAWLEMILSDSMQDMAGLVDEKQARLAADRSTAQLAEFFEGSTIRAELPAVTAALKQLYGPLTPTILASLKSKLPAAEVEYIKGCQIAGTDRSGFAAAVKAAAYAEVVILALGGKYGWGNNCTIGEAIDSDHIGLSGVQEELAKEIFATGTPTVVLHLNARPLSSEFIAENCPAILECWFPGITGGEALADVLFGDYNPAGRLPVTVARNAGQIPIYSAHSRGDSYDKVVGMVLNKYVEGSKEPLFYFGEGQSYTQFEYSNLKLDREVEAGGTVNLSFDVSNTGSRYGEEVAQIYVSDEISSMMRPAKELAGFARLALEPGETKRVCCALRADQFAFLDADFKWIVEAGVMLVNIGGSSEDTRLSGRFKIKDTAHIEGKTRGFYADCRVERP